MCIRDRFVRSRDGDRFFFESTLDDLLWIDSEFESTLLSDIILRNTDIVSLQSNVFLSATAVPEPSTLAVFMVLNGTVLLRRRAVV